MLKSFHAEYCPFEIERGNYKELDFEISTENKAYLLNVFTELTKIKKPSKETKNDDTRRVGPLIRETNWEAAINPFKKDLTKENQFLGAVVSDSTLIPEDILSFLKKSLKTDSWDDIFAMFIVTKSKQFLQPHAERRSFALNILLQNPEPEKTFVTFHSENGSVVDFHSFSKSSGTVVYNTSTWHAVWNQSNFDRIALSFSLRTHHSRESLSRPFGDILKNYDF